MNGSGFVINKKGNPEIVWRREEKTRLLLNCQKQKYLCLYRK
jgi:hypothetical protein